jgi:hypothetical protein
MNYGLYVVDVSDPANPVTLDTYGPGLEVNSLAMYGDHVLLGEEEEGFRTVEVFQRSFDIARNMVYSLPVAPGEAVSRVRVGDSRSYICLWEVCTDSAGHWQHVYEDSGWTDMDYPGDNLRWRATLIYDGGAQNPGAGMLSIEYDDLAGVDSDGRELVFGLSPCRPNPLVSETTIAFAIPERMNVKLSIHDVAGRHVATLTEGAAEAGRHSVTWKGLTSAGRRASPGVYFARIEAGRYEATTKVVVLD